MKRGGRRGGEPKPHKLEALSFPQKLTHISLGKFMVSGENQKADLLTERLPARPEAVTVSLPATPPGLRGPRSPLLRRPRQGVLGRHHDGTRAPAPFTRAAPRQGGGPKPQASRRLPRGSTKPGRAATHPRAGADQVCRRPRAAARTVAGPRRAAAPSLTAAIATLERPRPAPGLNQSGSIRAGRGARRTRRGGQSILAARPSRGAGTDHRARYCPV